MKRKPHLKAKVVDGRVQFFLGNIRVRFKRDMGFQTTTRQSMGNAEVKCTTEN